MRPRLDLVRPGQRSVWDCRRPAIADSSAAHGRIERIDQVVADTRASVRSLESNALALRAIPGEE
ncbi:MAG: hypothetical protein LH466_09710 [Sphingomonas bacterium]|nr:hypothetical protein [Sphingomonas bacterium]